MLPSKQCAYKNLTRSTWYPVLIHLNAKAFGFVSDLNSSGFESFSNCVYTDFLYFTFFNSDCLTNALY